MATLRDHATLRKCRVDHHWPTLTRNSRTNELTSIKQTDGRGARVIELLELGDNEQRGDFGFHRHVAGDEDHRSVFAQSARKRGDESGNQRRLQGRQNYSPQCR